MTREKLETYLGTMVEITLFDGEVVKGCLRKSGTEMFKDNPNLYIPQKMYFMTDNPQSKNCISCLFRSSHVTKLRELN